MYIFNIFILILILIYILFVILFIYIYIYIYNLSEEAFDNYIIFFYYIGKHLSSFHIYFKCIKFFISMITLKYSIY